jgi:hypothetical protein
MISSAVVSHIRGKVATPGGTLSAIPRIRDSEMGPGHSISNARGNMLTRKSRLLLGVMAATPLLFAACRDNSIVNPMANAAGDYTLTVYAGRSIPATYQIQPGDPNFPLFPNGGTLVVTGGDLVLGDVGTFIETNNYSNTPTGGQTTTSYFVSSGTWTLSGTTFTLSDPSRNRLVTGTLALNVNNKLTVNYMADNGTGLVQAYEYIR